MRVHERQPKVSGVVLRLRLLFAYDVPMPEEKGRGALLVAACIVAAIRLRGEPTKPSRQNNAPKGLGTSST
jgi:hypothetical protein